MWVEVLGVLDGTSVGALTNMPRAITTIGLGDRVDFGPEHVISTLEDWHHGQWVWDDASARYVPDSGP